MRHCKPGMQTQSRSFWHMKRSEFFANIPRADLAHLISALDRPGYLYFGAILEHQVAKIRDCLGAEFDINYALKANPHPAILRRLAALGLGADVASGGELQASLDAGFPGERIEFSGPGKQHHELDLAIRSHIGCINIENLSEIDMIAQICRETGFRANVGLRLNPGRIANSTGMRMAGDTQFGLPIASAGAALKQVKDLKDQIDFVGFHAHLASQELDAAKLAAKFEAIVDCAAKLSLETGMTPSKLNFGGGWGIDYFANQHPLDVTALKRALQSIVKSAAMTEQLGNPRLCVEPGRFVSGECGVFATRVLYRKETGDSTFLITDGGMNANYILAGGMGQVIQRNFELDILTAEKRTKVDPHVVNIAGPLCTPQDVLARNVSTDIDVRPGDTIVFFNCGAYGPTASPINFLGHSHPQEIFVKA